MPLNCTLSADRLIKKVRNSNSRFQYEPEKKVSKLYYFLPVYVAIGLVYFDSVFYKTTSSFWMEGLGMWRPASLPQFNLYGDNFSLNSQWFSKFLGFTTLIFETVFIFLFWYRPFRIPFLILGIGLHLGILIFFPIPWFALGVIAIYFLLVPISFWKYFKLPSFTKKPSLFFIYDNDCPLCHRTRITIQSLDIFKKIEFITIHEARSKFATHAEFMKINEKELQVNIHSIDSSGKIHVGLSTYIQVFFRMLYTFPIAILLIIPGIYHLAKFVYTKIALNRERTPCNDENCVLVLPPVMENPDERKIFANFTYRKLHISILILLFASTTLIQTAVSYNSGIILQFREKAGITENPVDRFLSKLSDQTNHYAKKFLGITHHPVFMDGHMDNYNHIFAIVYVKDGKEIWLPIINEKGQPERMIYGPRWVKWTFRVNSPTINAYNLEKGTRDFSAFWLGEQQMGFDQHHFEIRMKKIELAQEFRENFISDQMAKEWQTVGEIHWVNKQSEVKIDYIKIRTILRPTKKVK